MRPVYSLWELKNWLKNKLWLYLSIFNCHHSDNKIRHRQFFSEHFGEQCPSGGWVRRIEEESRKITSSIFLLRALFHFSPHFFPYLTIQSEPTRQIEYEVFSRFSSLSLLQHWREEQKRVNSLIFPSFHPLAGKYLMANNICESEGSHVDIQCVPRSLSPPFLCMCGCTRKGRPRTMLKQRKKEERVVSMHDSLLNPFPSSPSRPFVHSSLDGSSFACEDQEDGMRRWDAAAGSRQDVVFEADVMTHTTQPTNLAPRDRALNQSAPECSIPYR